MAITRAQQKRQLRRRGGIMGSNAGSMLVTPTLDGSRPGYYGPDAGFGDAAYKDKAASSPIDQGIAPGGSDEDFQRAREAIESRTTEKTEKPKDKPPLPKPKETKFQKFKRTYNPFPLATSVLNRISNSKLARINNAMQRQNYIDSLDLTNPKEKEEYDRIMNQLGGLGMDIIAGPEDLEDTSLKQPMSLGPPKTTFKTVDGVSTLGNPGVDDVLGAGYDEYLNRFETEERDERPEEIIDPCKGPNPPAYCFIGEKADETIEAQRNLAGLTPRIGGSIFNFDNMADGGIAGLDREAFLLGGIAKGLKKAVRGLKKVAKSPIGKAALLGGLAYFGGGGGLPKFLSGKGLGGFSMETLFSKANPLLFTKGKLSLGKLALASAATPFLFPGEKEDEFDLDAYYAANQLEPSQSIRGMGSEFDFYGGQRMRVADGGDVEPVATKTLPLIDMDGKEKDYRETGGFVDMGRMERADDVPARLSKNEFVFTADAVRNAGEGDIDKGAEVMYNMMKNLEAGGEVSEESQGLEGARKMFQTSQRLGEVI